MDLELETLSTSKLEEDSLDLLPNELVQVFSFENIDKSTEAQREELIQRILKLGGNNYTCEDLRRDLLNIEIEDNDKSQSRISGNGLATKQKDKVVGMLAKKVQIQRWKIIQV